jgi:hypothetical protein
MIINCYAYLREVDRLDLAHIDQAALASPYRGPIAVQRNADGLLIPQEALFQVCLSQCQTSEAPAAGVAGECDADGARVEFVYAGAVGGGGCVAGGGRTLMSNQSPLSILRQK